jgi:hypothetical protein
MAFAVDASRPSATLRAEVTMEQLVEFLTRWLTLLFDNLSSAIGSAISIFDWPAQAMGVPSEALAAVMLCLALLALWRAMGGYFT